MNIIFCKEQSVDALTAGLILALDCINKGLVYHWTQSLVEVSDLVAEQKANSKPYCVIALIRENETSDFEDELFIASGNGSRITVTAPAHESLAWEVLDLRHLDKPQLYANPFLSWCISFLKFENGLSTQTFVCSVPKTPRSYLLYSKYNDLGLLAKKNEADIHQAALIETIAVNTIPSHKTEIPFSEPFSAYLVKTVGETAILLSGYIERELNRTGDLDSWYGYTFKEIYYGGFGETLVPHEINIYCFRNIDERVTEEFSAKHHLRRNFSGFITWANKSV